MVLFIFQGLYAGRRVRIMDVNYPGTHLPGFGKHRSYVVNFMVNPYPGHSFGNVGNNEQVIGIEHLVVAI
jgi:hypothetical protein